MTNQRKILVLVAMLVAVNLVMGVRWYMATRSTPSSNDCINNLRQIDAIEQQWAQEHHKTTNDVPTWDEVQAYLSGKPVCPQGGTYGLGRVGEPPTCSIGGPGHTLPTN